MLRVPRLFTDRYEIKHFKELQVICIFDILGEVLLMAYDRLKPAIKLESTVTDTKEMEKIFKDVESTITKGLGTFENDAKMVIK